MNARNYGNNSAEGIGKLNDKLLYQRVIAGFNVMPLEQLKFSAHIQDSRAFGWSLRNSRYPKLFQVREKGTHEPWYTMNPNEEFFEIYDAYVEYDEAHTNFTVKAGRQKIFYGDYRIFGPGDWGNTGRWTWDAVKLSYRKEDNFIDVFAGGTKIHDPEAISLLFSNTEYWGGGMYAHFKITESWRLEPFYAYKTQGSAPYINTRRINRHWTGTRFYTENLNGFLLDGTIVKQFGSEDDKRISAFGAVAKLGYRFDFMPAKPLLSLRETFATGGRETNDVIGSFEPVFGASDKFYGWMNIVSWSNLDNREILLELTPSKNMWVEIKFNRYRIPVPDDVKLLGTMELQEGEKHLGDEFNIFLRSKAGKHWQIVGVLGYFIPGKLRYINDEPPKDSKWMALQVLFSI